MFCPTFTLVALCSVATHWTTMALPNINTNINLVLVATNRIVTPKWVKKLLQWKANFSLSGYLLRLVHLRIVRPWAAYPVRPGGRVQRSPAFPVLGPPTSLIASPTPSSIPVG